MSDRTERPILAVIGCSKKKDDTPGTIPAHRRYTGSLFQAQLAYAQTGLGLDNGAIYVASARLGLIGIETPAPDYDLSLADLPAAQRRQWGRAVALAVLERNPQRLYLLAGQRYRRAIVEFLPELEVVTPTAELGLGYAQQTQWYHRHTRKELFFDA